MRGVVGVHVRLVGQRRVGARTLLKRANKTRLTLGVCCLLVLSVLAPRTAFAHPDLDRAIHLSAELEFEPALRAFRKALDSGKLTKDELATLLAERALMLHALRRQGEVISDFRSLAAVDPTRKLDRRAPPDLTALWDSLRAEARGKPASVELRNESQPGVLRLQVQVDGARPPELRIEAHFRHENGAFTAFDAAHGVEKNLPEGADVQAYARLLGLGGTELSAVGSVERPLLFRVPSVEEKNSGPLSDGPERKNRKWIWIGAATVVVVAGAITAAALALSSEDSTSVRVKPVANF